MDIFTIDSASVNSSLQNASATVDDDVFDQIPEVSFEAGREFNLNFFDNPDDSNTLGGYSDPGSVESTSIGSPPSIKHFGGNHNNNNNNGNGIDNNNGTSFQLCQTPALSNIKCGMHSQINNLLTFFFLKAEMLNTTIKNECSLSCRSVYAAFNTIRRKNRPKAILKDSAV